ncbi:MAG: hypothetical protein GY696_19455, partial [Gammaproteobacteria bacterium]|nr:hypothetical protein [Gammaproteobacteria bacterium]
MLPAVRGSSALFSVVKVEVDGGGKETCEYPRWMNKTTHYEGCQSFSPVQFNYPIKRRGRKFYLKKYYRPSVTYYRPSVTSTPSPDTMDANYTASQKNTTENVTDANLITREREQRRSQEGGGAGGPCRLE